jgi:hypothetical protein
MMPIRSDVLLMVGMTLSFAFTGAAASRAQEAVERARPSRRPEFRFTRAAYGSWRFNNWAVDYPKADRQFLIGVRRLTILDADDREHAVRLDDPELRKTPFLYAVEVGRMSLNEDEVLGLRSYLEAGGFLLVDDFWGTDEWQNFEYEIRRVLPGRSIEEISLDHPVFSSFYWIRELLQVPSIRVGMSGGPTWERDGYVPHCRGIHDDNGRLMVLINWNSDLGDAWEWAESPYYPLKYSTFAYQLGINAIVYAMSH